MLFPLMPNQGFIEWNFSGVEEMKKLLKQLPEKAAKRVLRNATRSAANVIKKEAAKRVVVRTGKLKKSLKVVESNYRDANGVRFRIGPTQFYAHLVEFGTTHSQAKPFLRPAYDESKQKVVDQMAKMMAKGIEREASRLAGNLGTKKRR